MPRGNGAPRAAVTGTNDVFSKTCTPIWPGTIWRSPCSSKSSTSPGGGGALDGGGHRSHQGGREAVDDDHVADARAGQEPPEVHRRARRGEPDRVPHECGRPGPGRGEHLRGVG